MSAEADRNPPFRRVQNGKGGRMLFAEHGARTVSLYLFLD
jgi:hypothetical protein